ncbi:homeobox protein NANOG isoform X2 [Castor canadensis]|uniref:Homeobox protein NANOG isoform X2 n=1 Tax=Castor canadensis TaxID=51338 RepID=A0AC58MPT7_CASCN
MSVDPGCPQSLPCSEAPNCRDCSPVPLTYGPEEDCSSLPMSSAELLHTETASPLPYAMDLLTQDSPDSSTSPKAKPPDSGSGESTVKKEDTKAQVKKQKMRTVFSQTQLCVLNDRFQKQKYLSLQQMHELSGILNLTYKQVKTWFQNQRMKSKRWQKSKWPKNGNGVTQGCMGNTPSNPPVRNSQAWNPAWSDQAWSSQSWSSHSWSTQTWYSQAWNSSFYNYGEEPGQPYVQFQQNYPVSDLETTLETAGESLKYFGTSQALDLFLNYSVNMQPDDM